MTKGIYSDLQPCEVNVNSSRYPDWSAEEGLGSRDGGSACQASVCLLPSPNAELCVAQLFVNCYLRVTEISQCGLLTCRFYPPTQVCRV